MPRYSPELHGVLHGSTWMSRSEANFPLSLDADDFRWSQVDADNKTTCRHISGVNQNFL